jgi:hypothetical protein
MYAFVKKVFSKGILFADKSVEMEEDLHTDVMMVI